MTKPQVKEFNCETGEEIVRDATDQEIAILEATYEEAKKHKELSQAYATERQAILDRLGITSEEAKILLGA
jgi:hypothetical protein